MRLLFDQNLSASLCAALNDVYPDSTHVRIVNLSQASDLAVWDFAKANHYTIVTKDADFAEMAALAHSRPKIVWLRVGNQPTSVIGGLLRSQADAILALDGDQGVICLELYL